MFCPKCGVSNDETSRFCRSCGAPVPVGQAPVQYTAPPPPAPLPQAPLQQAPPPPQYPVQGDPRVRGVAYPNRQYAVGRNPGVALILSILLPGVGQFYNGDTKKGLLMLLGALLLGPVTLFVVWLAILVWSAIDAYQVASGKSPLW